MSEINWKNKYDALKAKFMESVDAAFRLGYEQGAQDAQVDSVMQQQQQQADQMQQDGEQQDAEGQSGDQNGEGDSGEQVPGDQAAPAPASANPAGSELDQHIQKLESMVAKGEISTSDLMKSIADFRNVQKNMVFEQEMKKSYEAIPAIAKALHKPSFKISQQANHNLSDSSKKAVGMQQKIVSDIMKSWAEEEQKASKGILNTLNVEGLIKKD